MRVRVPFPKSILFLCGGLLLGACSLDHGGLAPTTDLSGSGGTIGGGSGGQPGSGGVDPGGSGGRGIGGIDGNGGNGGLTGSGGAATGTGGAAMGSCNPTSCPDGCCMGSQCVTGGNGDRCGIAGATCAPCPDCYRCGDSHACEVDPNSRWNVICESATIAATKPNNTPWDTPGPGISPLPDPYCQFVLDGAPRARTMTLLNTATPVWSQSITPASMSVTAELLTSQSQPWSVAVVDEDVGAMPVDPVCSSAPRLTAADFAAGTVALPPRSQNCTSLTIQVVCQP